MKNPTFLWEPLITGNAGRSAGSWGRTGWQALRCSPGPGGWKLSHHLHEFLSWHQLHTPPHLRERFSGAASQKALLAPTSTRGWKSLLFSQWTHSQLAYPGLKGWQNDVKTFQPPKPPVYSSYAFSLVEGRTLVDTYSAYPRRISVCQAISANLAHSQKSQFPQSILSCWRILQDCISALQSCAMILCLLYQYSTLTSTEVPFFCLL